MKSLTAPWLLLAVAAAPLALAFASIAADPPSHKPPRKNHAVALLAGAALHLTQDAQALQRSATKRREKVHGRKDPQVRAGHRRLQVIHRKMGYFRHVKRQGEGRR